jgi:hypothetical protein
MSVYPKAGGPRLADFLDGLPIVTRWLAGHPVVWQTGQQDGPEEPPPASHHTHCSAFSAAVALYLDIYLLRPPNHGQVLLANAQTDWLSGDESYPGPTAASVDWTQLGFSGDPDALTSSVAAANAGQLVLACYAAPPSPSGKPVSGHVAIVRPRNNGDPTVPPDGPDVIMAGAQNYTVVSMRKAFSNHPDAWPDNIALFAHQTVLQHDVSG